MPLVTTATPSVGHYSHTFCWSLQPHLLLVTTATTFFGHYSHDLLWSLQPHLLLVTTATPSVGHYSHTFCWSLQPHLLLVTTATPSVGHYSHTFCWSLQPHLLLVTTATPSVGHYSHDPMTFCGLLQPRDTCFLYCCCLGIECVGVMGTPSAHTIQAWGIHLAVCLAGLSEQPHSGPCLMWWDVVVMCN